MGKDKVEKEKKRAEKKEKRAEKDGVHKSKKDKKEKKDKTALADAVEKEITTQVLDGLDQAASAAVVKTTVDVAEPMEIEALVGALVPFAQPLVEDKTAKKVLKSVKKAAVNKSLKRGVKEVVKALRKSPIPPANTTITEPSGIVILAADISPMDVISHIPVLCEDHGIPYVFVTSRAELGASAATKRPTSVVMVVPKSGKGKKGESEDGEDFGKVFEELTKLTEKEGKKLTA
ncbi:H/ACA ribonucleoprotein complex subunit 2 [Penicillium lagena]|uniref:H/ACA ribonucleoprotein complex subunit 2 n=1 Tax=Penicillium lagena TaxID=94218 RepID=UPI002541B2FD|nr:H/ACA ribonucleoprotein complex subunit 2 [Penicillium lagena]KAJ5618878.1 H/ACA ribonucleoprotein complex subunit 2 [Penicillium lagena]